MTSNTLTIEEIVNKIIIDKTSPISSWLINVIETYLNFTQSTEALTINKLYKLTNDMLLTYSITTSQSESRDLCETLIDLLETNKHIPSFVELYPLNTQCIALYLNDNKWYNATIIEIIESGLKYNVAFDDYGNKQTVNIQQLKQIKIPQTQSISTISLKDSIRKITDNDKKLNDIMHDNSTDASCGLKKKKKYVNDMIDVIELPNNDIDDDNDDEKDFKVYISENQKDDGVDMDDNISKYMVGNGKNRRKINPQNDICCVCARTLPVTFHHLIPKSTHNRYIKQFKNKHNRDYLNSNGIWICRQCHSAIHGIYPSNWMLATQYFQLDLLLKSDKIQKWIKYISKKKISHHYDKRTKKINRVGQIQSDKTDHTTKIKYIQ